MSAAAVDLHYSVERYFQETYSGSYEIAYEGAAFRQDGHSSWVHLAIFGPTGRPSRAGDYSAAARISLRIVARTSMRAVRIIAQAFEDGLRGGSIPIYDEGNRTLVLGYLRLQDPSFQPLPRDGTLHQGVLQIEGTLNMDLP